jgi:hypothetical protein
MKKRESNMNSKIIAALLTAAAAASLLTGCGAPQNTAAQGAQTTQSSQTEQGKASDAEQAKMLEGLKTVLSAEGAEKAALEEMGKDMPSMSSENASEMLLAFEKYQQDALVNETFISDGLAAKLSASGLYSEADINDPDKIKDADAKAAVQDILDRGYKIIVPEGMYQTVINYSVYRQFEEYVSGDDAAYIEIEAAESDGRTLEDAGIIIPISEVYARAAACGDFLEKWPQSQRAEAVKVLYDTYIDSYFYGQNNTPAFDYTTKKLNQEFRDSYEAAAKDDTPVGKAAAEYLAALEKNGYALTDDVSACRDKLVAELEGK